MGELMETSSLRAFTSLLAAGHAASYMTIIRTRGSATVASPASCFVQILGLVSHATPTFYSQTSAILQECNFVPASVGVAVT